METKKRQSRQEFKKEAVEYSLASDKTVVEVARDLGIPHHNLDRWRTQYHKDGELAFPGHGKENLTAQEEKLILTLRKAQVLSKPGGMAALGEA